MASKMKVISGKFDVKLPSFGSAAGSATGPRHADAPKVLYVLQQVLQSVALLVVAEVVRLVIAVVVEVHEFISIHKLISLRPSSIINNYYRYQSFCS